MAYSITQNIESLPEEQNFEHKLTTTLEKGKFLAITENKLEEGSNQRVITAQIMSMEEAEGGETSVPITLVKGEKEDSIKVIVNDETGNQIASSETKY
ncbi:hypothetical protein [Roseivirga seohaensis]|uniref:Curli assembly protein CsgC n=1 Tax=Roseivirga seohaensis TaxID=1914963 RepID=A0A150XQB9_9BACT|nr:hypothetical protein [Roseivirga seohaensis]KYG80913.1 hypothetical protein AWW67_08825 [Roseivirga seohaensis]|tara:strand:+ start:3947 stop:4240 length:294 start_codon:yes stop_codon:yes gene_type:complete